MIADSDRERGTIISKQISSMNLWRVEIRGGSFAIYYYDQATTPMSFIIVFESQDIYRVFRECYLDYILT